MMPLVAAFAPVLLGAPLALPSWSIAVDPYGGVGVMVSRGATESIPLGGGLLRIRIQGLEIGGYAEAAVLTDDTVTSAGGLAGAFLPFRRWVAVELAAGYGARIYENRSARLSAGDYRVAIPAGTLLAGVSDRVGALLGFRLGAHLVACLDLAPKDLHWKIEASEHNPSGSSGVRHFGGLSVAMVLSIGTDVTPR
jgi:hypothetical protein